MVAVSLLTVTPWLIRDVAVFHQFVPISTEDRDHPCGDVQREVRGQRRPALPLALL